MNSGSGAATCTNHSFAPMPRARSEATVITSFPRGEKSIGTRMFFMALSAEPKIRRSQRPPRGTCHSGQVRAPATLLAGQHQFVQVLFAHFARAGEEPILDAVVVLAPQAAPVGSQHAPLPAELLKHP